MSSWYYRLRTYENNKGSFHDWLENITSLWVFNNFERNKEQIKFIAVVSVHFTIKKKNLGLSKYFFLYFFRSKKKEMLEKIFVGSKRIDRFSMLMLTSLEFAWLVEGGGLRYYSFDRFASFGIYDLRVCVCFGVFKYYISIHRCLFIQGILYSLILFSNKLLISDLLILLCYYYYVLNELLNEL